MYNGTFIQTTVAVVGVLIAFLAWQFPVNTVAIQNQTSFNEQAEGTIQLTRQGAMWKGENLVFVKPPLEWTRIHITERLNRCAIIVTLADHSILFSKTDCSEGPKGIWFYNREAVSRNEDLRLFFHPFL